MTAETEFMSTLRAVVPGGLRFFNEIGSTNDEALAWASQGAPDFSLVAADAQSNGRGRMGRRWVSSPGAGLAFSLVMRPLAHEREHAGRFSGLGALALVRALGRRGLQAQVKWPNDVLLEGKKTAGILVEAAWMGPTLEALVLGMGVNITPAAVPQDGQLSFPATCVEAALGHSVTRFELLRDILLELASLREILPGPAFISAWQDSLAFVGERVFLWRGGQSQPAEVTLLGLEANGSLCVLHPGGERSVVHAGEVHLRPVVLG